VPTLTRLKTAKEVRRPIVAHIARPLTQHPHLGDVYRSHLSIQRSQGLCVEGNQLAFDSLTGLIQHHKSHYLLSPRDVLFVLKYPFSSVPDLPIKPLEVGGAKGGRKQRVQRVPCLPVEE
jgi:hypothetical protein